jgi:hypothetical protein
MLAGCLAILAGSLFNIFDWLLMLVGYLSLLACYAGFAGC